MIKAKRDFAQVKMEKLLRHSAIHIKPMLGIAPEAFNAIDVVSAAGSPFLLADDDMLAAHCQRSVSLPVIRVVEAARQCVSDDQAGQLNTPSPFDREYPHQAVAFEDAEDNDFAGSAPTSFTRSVAAKHRLIALNCTIERLGAFFGMAEHLAYHAIESFNRRRACQSMKAKAVRRHAQDEVINKPPLGGLAQARSSPCTTVGVATLAAAALKAPISQRPCPMMSTTRT